MNTNVADVLKQHLYEDERLLWTSRPGRRLVVYLGEIVGLAASAGFIGCAVFVPYNAHSSEPIFLVFAAVLFAASVWKLILVNVSRANTYYGISNERILILITRPSRRLHFVNFRTLAEMGLEYRLNRPGKLRFGPPPRPAGYEGTVWQASPFRIEFDRIDNPRGVYAIIRAAREDMIAGRVSTNVAE